ncbi:MAG TPA: hypothetical protein PLZ51_25915, partial [Aggregatilineales bacterium]|nr:hypothetical protein [Aggregatilineales bacterium]
LCYAIRHILGFQDRIYERTRVISLSMFQNGYGKYRGCGLGKNAIIRALVELKKFRLLIPLGDPTSNGQAYRVADESDFPDFAGLEHRAKAQAQRNKRRTQKARAVVMGASENETDEA